MAQRAARHPHGRLGTPEEIAAAVIRLCFDASSFVTGQSLATNGGYSPTSDDDMRERAAMRGYLFFAVLTANGYCRNSSPKTIWT
ncbi:MAG: SDR family oxidoreductase, partial [Thermomicrobia bacterium]|nr:SDR family oxidoreductase [Thermomicrobia bacterium]